MAQCKAHEHTRAETPCPNESLYSWVWSWGQEGECCAQCAPLIHSLGQQLSQPVVLTLMQTPVPAPSESERVQALELELEQTKAELRNALAAGDEDLQELEKARGKLQGAEFDRDQLKGQLDEVLRQHQVLDDARQELMAENERLLLEREELRKRLADTNPPGSPS